MADRERKITPEGPGMDPSAWMITFSDLLTLMLTFFVLLFSMSSLDAKALKELTESAAMGGGDGVLALGAQAPVVPKMEVAKPKALPAKMTSVAEDLAQYLRMVGRGVSDDRRRLLEKRILERGKQEKVEITFLPTGIQIAFEDDEDAFGKDNGISRAAQDQLRMVGDAAVESGARVRVETVARGDGLSSWMAATEKASNISEFIRRHSGIKKKRNRLGVAPNPVGGGARKVRMVLEMPDSKGIQ
jgi:chemotaxis protein MotB